MLKSRVAGWSGSVDSPELGAVCRSAPQARATRAPSWRLLKAEVFSDLPSEESNPGGSGPPWTVSIRRVESEDCRQE